MTSYIQLSPISPPAASTASETRNLQDSSDDRGAVGPRRLQERRPELVQTDPSVSPDANPHDNSHDNPHDNSHAHAVTHNHPSRSDEGRSTHRRSAIAHHTSTPNAEPPELRGLLELPATLVSGLPAPVSLHLRVAGAPVPVVVWTGEIHPEARANAPVLADAIVFDGREFDALVCAAGADRLWHSDFLGLCFEKWRRPDVPTSHAALLGGANPDPNTSWSLGRVLRRLGVELEAFAFEREPIAKPLHAAA